MHPKINELLSKPGKWNNEIQQLRKIILGCGLNEDFKWGSPCYTYNGNNIVIIQAFKTYLAIGFFNGYLLKDSHNILTAPGENSRVMRQIRFTDAADIIKKEKIIKEYIHQAVEAEKSGIKPAPEPLHEMKLPEELAAKFESDPRLKEAFYKLTPGRQRAYIIYISGAKQLKTRLSRIEKSIPQIFKGKGYDE